MQQAIERVTTGYSEYQTWLERRHQQLEGAYGLSQCEWELSQDEQVVRYRRNGVVQVVATYRFIGSYSAQNGTWLWAWANPAIDRALQIQRSECVAWAHDTGLDEFSHPAFTVTDCPELWRDTAASWEHQQLSQTTISRIASMVTYAIDGLGVLYYTVPGQHVVGCVALTQIYTPVRSC